nr:MAG: protein of unknown function, DUF2892 [Candidatus Nanosalinarum sp. J07AB56]
MEQNLSEKERNVRLGIGIALGTVSAVVLVTGRPEAIPDEAAAGLGLASIGFFVNYFTCFCGTKRLVRSAVNKVR